MHLPIFDRTEVTLGRKLQAVARGELLYDRRYALV
jgi:hypothetical protein